MKIAVCISGIYNPNIESNNVLREKFPTADFYYATWYGCPSNDQCSLFEEPTPHYHPWLDIKEEHYLSPHYKNLVNMYTADEWMQNWSIHHAKQILIHCWLIAPLQNSYDVIVRTRFDNVTYEGANFDPYVHDTFVHQRSNCFATPYSDFTQLVPADHTENNSFYSTWMMDQLIIHPAKAIDVSNVNRLYAEKKLQGGEPGWYQVLSHPHGGTHRNYKGWATKL